MKNKQSNRSLVLTTAVAAAIGAMAAFAPMANAQQRVGSDGKLMDASNRVGSGGFNDSSASALPPGVFGNALVNRDVTGGVGFQGSIPYFDPGAFHGVLPGQGISDFAAQSTNVQTNGTIINNSQNVHLFLGDGRGVNPPSNFVSTGAQPGYIPAAPVTDTSFTSDARLGSPSAFTPISSSVPSAIFQTGGTQAGGGPSTYVTASSLFGQRTLQTQQQNGQLGTTSSSALGSTPIGGGLGTGDRIDLSAETRLQSLNDSTSNGALTPSDSTGLSALGMSPGVSSYATPRAGSTNGINQAGQQGNNQQGTNPQGQAGSRSQGANSVNANNSNSPNSANLDSQAANGGPQNAAINAQIGTGKGVNGSVPSGYPLNSSVGGNAFSGSIATGEDSSTNIYSPSSNLPGSAYQRMVQRLKSINPNAPLSPVERSLLNQAKAQDIKTAAAQTTNSPNKSGGAQGTPNNSRSGRPGDVPPPGLGLPAVGPSDGGATGLTAPQQSAPQTGKNRPILLPSFSDDDQASAGTKKSLKKAEDLMKQGKFTSALEEYDLVEQQAPAQPFVQLARANAELGASYYGLAEAHLRQAFMSDQALLSAQLDLHSLLGQDKLQYLITDLKQIATANPSESRPVFLLSYIYYNTNDERKAAAYLNLAEKREGKPDPFFKLLHQHWDLPDINDQKGDTEMNK